MPGEVSASTMWSAWLNNASPSSPVPAPKSNQVPPGGIRSRIAAATRSARAMRAGSASQVAARESKGFPAVRPPVVTRRNAFDTASSGRAKQRQAGWRPVDLRVLGGMAQD